VTAPGAIVNAAQVRAGRTPTGVVIRELIGPGPDGPGLSRRLVDIPKRARCEGVAGAAGELWYVIGGTGSLETGGGDQQPLRPGLGLWVPAGSMYLVRASDDADLRVDVVTLPASPSAQRGAGQAPAPIAPLVRELSDCDVEVTGDRRFRVLFGPGRDCEVATQFVGEIPPGRAPDHSHPYDELVLILEGEGTAHIGGAGHPVSPGTCLHLAPGLRHCLENTGATTMRVLGVFHPADSPAAKLDHR
jgi:quercetin dioxygenase-like cupin family protein